MLTHLLECYIQNGRFHKYVNLGTTFCYVIDIYYISIQSSKLIHCKIIIFK